MAAKTTTKNAAQFFANNRHIAGFDNPGKSLYTTVREFVENALDAAETMAHTDGTSPQITVTIEEIPLQQLDVMRGVAKGTRVNHDLYADSAKSAATKGKRPATASDRPAGEVGEQDAPDNLNKDKDKEACKQRMFYRVTVEDNGTGMPHEQVPSMLGQVLSGTKYDVRQQRGKYGLGAKMALIWAKQSTSIPISVTSAYFREKTVSAYELDIDMDRNVPVVVKADKRTKQGALVHGTTIAAVIEGQWTSYRAKILQYMRLLAVITPCTQFEFVYRAHKDDSKSFKVRYAKRSERLPPLPQVVKCHPASVDLITMESLLKDSKSKGHSLLQHLTQQYNCMSPAFAQKLIDELPGGYSASSSVGQVHINELHNLFREAKFPEPKADCLSPAGEYNLRLGVMKEIRPDMIATYQEKPRVYEGHPFVVEAAVSIGGRSVAPGINVYRFANRIPLLFEQGSDVVTQQCRKINWAAYKMRFREDRIGVFVSIVSTKIPFKGTGKEYVGDDIPEISAGHAIMQCCAQLRVKLVRLSSHREMMERRAALRRFIPIVSSSITTVIKRVADHLEREPNKRRRILEDTSDEFVRRCARNELDEKTLARRLEEYIDKTAAEGDGGAAEPQAVQQRVLLTSPHDGDRVVTLTTPMFSLHLFDSAQMPMEL